METTLAGTLQIHVKLDKRSSLDDEQAVLSRVRK